MPTALELTRAGWQAYVDTPRSVWRPQPPTAAELQLRERILADLQQVAVVLKQRFGVRRVILFGSLADASGFHADSDVDLAVVGLAPGDYWAAWRTVEDTIRDRPVDFVDVESVSQSLWQLIEAHGIDL